MPGLMQPMCVHISMFQANTSWTYRILFFEQRERRVHFGVATLADLTADATECIAYSGGHSPTVAANVNARSFFH